MTIITLDLLKKIKAHAILDWNSGLHGLSHFARVYHFGMRLCDNHPEIKRNVVQLFSVLHDCQRRNELYDKWHGRRGAELAVHLRPYLPITDDEFSILVTACSLHTVEKTHENVTVQACFDSDRLDLWRIIGTVPDPDFLSTPTAKLPETIEWTKAYSRSRNMPDHAFGIEGFDKNKLL
jgi:uncharacterized protein